MPDQSRDALLRAIREQAQHPASSRELMQLLAVPREQRPAFRRQLKGLVAEMSLSAMTAPIYMIGNTRAVYEIFTGRDAGWTAQARTSWP